MDDATTGAAGCVDIVAYVGSLIAAVAEARQNGVLVSNSGFQGLPAEPPATLRQLRNIASIIAGLRFHKMRLAATCPSGINRWHAEINPAIDC